MRFITADHLARVLDYPSLADRIERYFREESASAPIRHRHTIPVPGEADAALLVMPAWRAGQSIGVKLVTVVPGNLERARPAISATYLMLDGTTGEPVALIDGAELTARRTGAASALAARYLAREDAAELLMVGTGALAPHLIAAHAAVRPIRRCRVWGRTPEKAVALARRLDRPGLKVEAVTDLEAAVRTADVISCATLSTQPLIFGAWLVPGQHLDLVGAFKPDMREADDDAVALARVFVDTRNAALTEGGEVVQALRARRITRAHILGDLFDLTHGGLMGRVDAGDITLFKSVGSAIEDLAAAELALERLPAL
jgi:alanine dehydrogenase